MFAVNNTVYKILYTFLTGINQQKINFINKIFLKKNCEKLSQKKRVLKNKTLSHIILKNLISIAFLNHL